MMRRAENRIYRQLSDANAYTPDSAIALSPNSSIEQKRLQSLIRGGLALPLPYCLLCDRH
jgi:hypothetical protein